MYDLYKEDRIENSRNQSSLKKTQSERKDKVQYRESMEIMETSPEGKLGEILKEKAINKLHVIQEIKLRNK